MSAIPDTPAPALPRAVESAIFLGSVGLFALFVALKLGAPEVYTAIIQEDALLENAQAVAYALAGLLAFVSAGALLRRGHRRLALLNALLGGALLFVCMEEISWGQRIFDVATTEWFARRNTQHELTLHNLAPVQKLIHAGYIAIGLYGGLGWLFVRRSSLPAADPRRFCTADPAASVYFLALAFVYLLLGRAGAWAADVFGLVHLHVGDLLVWRDQEPAETMGALGFLAVTASNLAKARRLQPRR